MTVYLAKLSRQNLQSISVDERVLFFSLAHLANEITALQKILLWSADFDSGNSAIINGQLSLTLMFVMLLAGKLHEGNKLLTTKFYGAQISQSYVSSLTQEGKECLDKIKSYFGRSNNVDLIRNNFAFHYSPQKIDDSLLTVPEEELDVYVQNQASANNLYYFAEALQIRALLKAMGHEDIQTAFHQLLKEIPEVSHWFSVVCDSLLTEFLKRYSSTIWETAASEVSFSQIPPFLSIKIPWFTDTSDIEELYKKLNT